MTFAWYAHLKALNHKPWIVAALISWGVALLEYLFQVPANRIGFQVLSIGQLKIMQEVITLTVFVPFSLLYLKEPLKLDYHGPVCAWLARSTLFFVLALGNDQSLLRDCSMCFFTPSQSPESTKALSSTQLPPQTKTVGRFK